MDVIALVFDGVMSRDVLAPIEALGPGATVRYVSPRGRPAKGFEPVHRFPVQGGLEVPGPTDLLVVPGGLGSVSMMREERVTRWIADAARRTTFVLSVSTGSLLLAAAGLLDDLDASGHWLARADLESAGAHASAAAVTRRGGIVTAEGAADAAEAVKDLMERLVYGPPGSPPS